MKHRLLAATLAASLIAPLAAAPAQAAELTVTPILNCTLTRTTDERTAESNLRVAMSVEDVLAEATARYSEPAVKTAFDAFAQQYSEFLNVAPSVPMLDNAWDATISPKRNAAMDAFANLMTVLGRSSYEIDTRKSNVATLGFLFADSQMGGYSPGYNYSNSTSTNLILSFFTQLGAATVGSAGSQYPRALDFDKATWDSAPTWSPFDCLRLTFTGGSQVIANPARYMIWSNPTYTFWRFAALSQDILRLAGLNNDRLNARAAQLYPGAIAIERQALG
ncbi:MAG: hypothetical protein Q3962_06150 [Corynebacterium sp.]|nr:hypothetical protein [Corynebacterium sp.]